MKIGLSYDQGTPKYRLYVGALLAAADRANVEVEPVWLAGRDRAFDDTAVQMMDGVLLTGGADVEPARYGASSSSDVCVTAEGRDDAEIYILEQTFRRRVPILAICRGMQLVNVFKGGTLVPDLKTGEAHKLPDDGRHEVEISPGSALRHLARTERGIVTSSHHQAVSELGEGLRSVAHHSDGTVEAMEWSNPMRKPWLSAVQWHPERMSPDEPLGAAVFRGFLQAVQASHS